MTPYRLGTFRHPGAPSYAGVEVAGLGAANEQAVLGGAAAKLLNLDSGRSR
jgi:hypothetical protein